MMRAPGKRMTDYLLIDISNSYTKLAFATRQRLGKPIRYPTNKLTIASLRQILCGRRVEAIIVSSVVPRRNKIVTAAAGSSTLLFLNSRFDLGVGIDYPAPQSIGADRLPNAAGVEAIIVSSVVPRRNKIVTAAAGSSTLLFLNSRFDLV